MNRKERRAARKHGTPGTPRPAHSADDEIAKLFFDATQSERAQKFEDAVRLYKRVLLLKPDHAEASNNLGRVLQTQGNAKEASIHYARALALMPQLLAQYAGICATLFALLPELNDALRRQTTAWPKYLTPAGLFGDNGLAAIAADPLLLHLLQSTPVRDVPFERLLTSLRFSFSTDALSKAADDTVLGFACALAKQCFINEYVFATTPEEDARVADLRSKLAGALATNTPVDPMWIAIAAMYSSLHTIPSTSALLDHTWMPAIEDLLTQQLREPARERELRDTIARLTAIDDETSKQVQQQYEENPYPRWVHPADQVAPVPIDQYLREQFPTSAFAPLGKTDNIEMLIAGCGTGQVA